MSLVLFLATPAMATDTLYTSATPGVQDLLVYQTQFLHEATYYVLNIPVLAGDILDVTAEMELTSSMPYNLFYASQIECAGTTGPANGGDVVPIYPASNWHVTVIKHHRCVVPAGMTSANVILWAWAGSTAARPGDYISLGSGPGMWAGYGEIQILKHSQ